MKNLKDNIKIKDFILFFKNKLIEKKLEENIAEYLFFELKTLDLNQYNQIKDEFVLIQDKKKYIKKINKVLKYNIPIQYVLKSAYFYRDKFYVNKNVLIPRFDSETIISNIVENVPQGDILELGTGSGALIISLKKANPKLNCEALDISSKALRVARRNAREKKININFFKSNLFEKVSKKYNIIIANLPYLKKEEIKGLLLKEPSLALWGKSNDGCFLIYKFLDKLNNYLKKDGYAIIEHSPGQEINFINYIKNKELPFSLQTIKDYNQLNRFSILRRKTNE